MTLAKRFNPKRPHGHVVGDPRLAFEQDGQIYNGAYQAVDVEGKLLPMEAAPPQKPDSLEEKVDEKIDLRAWADGKIKAPWPAVAAALQERFDVVVSNKDEAKTLIDENMPTAKA